MSTIRPADNVSGTTGPITGTFSLDDPGISDELILLIFVAAALWLVGRQLLNAVRLVWAKRKDRVLPEGADGKAARGRRWVEGATTVLLLIVGLVTLWLVAYREGATRLTVMPDEVRVKYRNPLRNYVFPRSQVREVHIVEEGGGRRGIGAGTQTMKVQLDDGSTLSIWAASSGRYKELSGAAAVLDPN